MTKTASQTNYSSGSGEAGSACYRCQRSHPSPENRPVKIRAAVFFDGTLNNRKNTEAGEKGIIKGESYRNALTNIAIMDRYYQESNEYDYSFSIYVEGIGTQNEKRDSINGMALGLGQRGYMGRSKLESIS